MGNKAYATITGFTALPPSPAAVSTDTFGGSSIDTSKWSVVTEGSTATVLEESGELQVTLTGTGLLNGGVQTVWPQYMAGSSVQVQLTDTSTAASHPAAGMTLSLNVGGTSQQFIGFTMETGVLYAQYSPAAGSAVTVRHDTWNSSEAYL